MLGAESVAANSPINMVRRMIDVPLPSDGKNPRWPHGWFRWENVKAAYRDAVADLLGNMKDISPGDGRGIVIVGGGAYFPGAYVLIRLLRHLGCSLPIELWHLPGEVDDCERKIVAPFNVRCVDPTPFGPFRILRGWHLKPIATLYSSFAEVICLDADSYPVRDPSFLFDRPEYRDHGAIFWPDYAPEDLQEKTFKAMGIEFRNEPDFETGQYVVDRRRCGWEIQLTHWINQHSDFYYRIPGEGSSQTTWRVWGDKSTYHLAWRRLGSDYGMPEKRPGWSVHTIMQHGFDGEVLFQHRCRDKFAITTDGLDKGDRKFFPSTPQNKSEVQERMSGWRHESECLRFLAELAEVYDASRSSKPAKPSF